MKEISSIDDLTEGLLICIDRDGELFNGYIIDVITSDYGLLTLILSHDGDFEEDSVDVQYDEDSLAIIDTQVYLI